MGDIDEDRALALAERYFGDLPGGSGSLRPRTPDPSSSTARSWIKVHDRVELDRVYLSWHTVPQFSSDDASLVLLSDILGRGKSSRLYRELVVRLGLAQDSGSYQSGRELAGSFGVTTTLRPGKSWEAAVEAVDGEIARIAESGVDEADLTRVQNGRVAGFIYALDNVGGFGGVADRLNAYNTYLGDPGRITTDLARYQAVTVEDIRRTARAYLQGRPRVVLAVQGRKPATTLPPLDRSIRPTSSRPGRFQAPRPVVAALVQGVPVWVIPRRDLPIVAATFVVDAGAATHDPSRGGLASLTADLLDEGTASRSSVDLALAIEGMGTSLSASAGWDGSYVGFQCLANHLEPTLDLAVDILREPTFPDSEWDRIHAQTLAGLRAERDGADARASRALLRALFPADHPYRIPVDGEEASVSRLSVEDLRTFHRDRYTPLGAACVVAGDVDPDAVVALLEARLSGWSGRSAPARAVPEASRGPRPRLLLHDRPGAPQAVVRVGQVGTHRLDPDYSELSIWNQILGGQFTSRLNAKLREERGFTYGVRSHFDFRRGAGPFVVASSLQADRLAEAIEDIRSEIVALLGDRPPTSGELDDARRSLIEGQARHFETPSSLVSRYAGLFLHGLPPDHHAGFADRLEAVELSGMVEAARRWVDPNSFVFVVVGDAETLAPTLDRLGWAEVERFDEQDGLLSQGGDRS